MDLLLILARNTSCATMAGRSSVFLLFLSLASIAGGQRPRALVIPVIKDPATLQYVARVGQRTPRATLSLAIHLGGLNLWVDCDSGYASTTYHPAHCGSALCSLAAADSCGQCFGHPRPGCSNNTCGTFPENPFLRYSTSGELGTDTLYVSSTDVSNTGPLVKDKSFLFACAAPFLLKGLARGAVGVAGFGRDRAAVPSQLASAFSLKRKFALCLSSSSRSPAVIFVGGGPYHLLLNVDASKSLLYTPLVTNPVSTAGVSRLGEPSYEYFISVKSIRVNEKPVPVNATLLSIDRSGVGGTKISTADPYMVLERSIYKTVVAAFEAAMPKNAKKVKGAALFELCYDAAGIGSTRVGPAVPSLDLVLKGKKETFWRMFGANTMVGARGGAALCLAVVDGGERPRTSVVIGGHQIEDNLLEFDLAASTLGFSSSLLFRQTTCANFNFTAAAAV